MGEGTVDIDAETEKDAITLFNQYVDDCEIGNYAYDFPQLGNYEIDEIEEIEDE
jgi:hypothetical protein